MLSFLAQSVMSSIHMNVISSSQCSTKVVGNLPFERLHITRTLALAMWIFYLLGHKLSQHDNPQKEDLPVYDITAAASYLVIFSMTSLGIMRCWTGR